MIVFTEVPSDLLLQVSCQLQNRALESPKVQQTNTVFSVDKAANAAAINLLPIAYTTDQLK